MEYGHCFGAPFLPSLLLLLSSATGVAGSVSCSTGTIVGTTAATASTQGTEYWLSSASALGPAAAALCCDGFAMAYPYAEGDVASEGWGSNLCATSSTGKCHIDVVRNDAGAATSSSLYATGGGETIATFSGSVWTEESNWSNFPWASSDPDGDKYAVVGTGVTISSSGSSFSFTADKVFTADGSQAAPVLCRRHTSAAPTSSPTSSPTTSPTSSAPTTSPSTSPTSSVPTTSPSTSPTSSVPTTSPTASPSASPTTAPTTRPSTAPTQAPTTFVELQAEARGLIEADGAEDAVVIEMRGNVPGITCEELKESANIAALNEKARVETVKEEGITNRHIVSIHTIICPVEGGIALPGRRRRQTGTAVNANGDIVATFATEVLLKDIIEDAVRSIVAAADAGTLDFSTVQFVNSSGAVLAFASATITGGNSGSVDVAALLAKGNSTVDWTNLIVKPECPAACTNGGKKSKKGKGKKGKGGVDCSACTGKKGKKGNTSKGGKKGTKVKKSKKAKKGSRATLTVMRDGLQTLGSSAEGLVAVVVGCAAMIVIALHRRVGSQRDNAVAEHPGDQTPLLV